ncbi:DUF1329 domain-containing protein [Caenimonas soli]|uniref:DUF1329 domain-containing protein n=1 Tax=Caenimonas soli TaxID=2735555 RepID=UPI00155665A4|nr:DUF1329 domain-containing protein [Caenimonas soli]NPC55918.1 DUF1329 domain-containing protein [Caenimonas soli]
MPNTSRLKLALVAALACVPMARAAVTAEEAAQLKTTLTPMGAERAGNKEGTIPAWTGGYTSVPSGYKSGTPRPDPFASEKPLYAVTADNMGKYADKLPDGAKALLTAHPKTFRIDVYPTHRTAAAPQWVYENTFKNATRAKTSANGVYLEGAYGGIPFPVPKTGHEAMWNQNLMYQGDTALLHYSNYMSTAEGKRTHISRGWVMWQFPYYFKDGSPETLKSGTHTRALLRQSEPAFKAGESFLLHFGMTHDTQAWQYLAGQRRVRKAPTVAYDTPNDVTSGLENYDETQIYNGALDRYNYKLIGKKEMLIPYNTHKFHLQPVEGRMGSRHLNPDAMRWELHRVWVVEATLADGKRHVVPKRTFYLDEDTWGAVWADLWDAQNQLWRSNHGLPMIVYEGPFVHTKAAYSSHNHLTGAFVISGQADYTSGPFWGLVDRKGDSFFTPDALAAMGR